MRKFSHIFLILLILSVSFNISKAYAFEQKSSRGKAVFTASKIKVFVSPDSSYTALKEFLISANKSLYINAYLFTSEKIAEVIERELEENTTVYILLDPSPVGGIDEREKEIIARLLRKGAKIYFFNKSVARFDHAKYAIADNASFLISTENFGDNGFPEDRSNGNRGWGAIVYSNDVSTYFAEFFMRDISLASKLNASYFEVKIKSNENEAKSEGSENRIIRIKYKPKFESRVFYGSFKLIPVIAPENALERILAFLSSANKSIKAEVFYAYKYWGKGKHGSIEKTPNLFLNALISAAEKGAKAKLLLDSTWYNIDKNNPRSNYYTAFYLNNLAEKRNISIEARLMNKKLGLKKLHAKGIIIDSRAVLISSVNWNENSPKRNREVGLIIYGEAPAKYFNEVFEHDSYSAENSQRLFFIKLAIVILILLFLFYVIRFA